MRDFLISVFITLVATTYLINPYWDKLKEVWIKQGKPISDINQSYNLLCAASYIVVGAIAYTIIAIIKLVYQHYNSDNK